MPLDLDDPTAVALAIFRAFSARRIEAALYGGLALAAYGEPRETRDADFAVAGLGGEAAAEALADTGVRPVLALDRARFGGLLISRITLAEGGSRAGLNVLDLVESRSTRFAEAALERAVTGSLRGTAIRHRSPRAAARRGMIPSRISGDGHDPPGRGGRRLDATPVPRPFPGAWHRGPDGTHEAVEPGPTPTGHRQCSGHCSGRMSCRSAMPCCAAIHRSTWRPSLSVDCSERRRYLALRLLLKSVQDV